MIVYELLNGSHHEGLFMSQLGAQKCANAIYRSYVEMYEAMDPEELISSEMLIALDKLYWSREQQFIGKRRQ